MAKDVNIHVKTTGAAQTQEQLKGTAKASREVGEQTAAGQQKGAQATDQATQKMGRMGRLLSSVKGQVVGLVGAWLGLQGVRRIVGYLIQQLEKVAQLQSQIHENSLSLMTLGQGLEFQTGTRGKQQFWAEQILNLQQAGGLASPDVAAKMLTAMDIATKEQLGGIVKPEVRQLAAQLAPFVGAAGLGEAEVSKLFEFATTAQVPLTETGFKDFFAQLHAAFTESKADIFGQFMAGLQTGVTDYIARGGTLQEGLATFVAARAVAANEAQAATMVEQLGRVASGGYKQPRLAVERALGVQFEDLSLDERKAAVLQYARELPTARREQILTKEMFPQEIAGQVGKLLTVEAETVLASVREAVSTATAKLADNLSADFMASSAGKAASLDAQIATRQAKLAPTISPWERRFQDAESKWQTLAAQGKDRRIKDSVEPYVIAFEEMREEVDQLITELPEGTLRGRAYGLRQRLTDAIWTRSELGLVFTPGMTKPLGLRFTHELDTLRAAIPEQGEAGSAPVGTVGGEGLGPPPSVHHHYDNSLNIYPRVGPVEKLLFTQVD